MPNLKREQKQRKEWDLMQAQGHLRYMVENTLSWIGTGAVIDAVMFCLDKFYGFHDLPWSIIKVVICFGITGLIQSELHWSDMKRKFRVPPPEEDWMAP